VQTVKMLHLKRKTLFMKKINLSIPDPCHENWEKMTGVEKGKFCSSCQKAVVDFTNMSDRQLADFFKKPKGTVCGRFNNDQLDRQIMIPQKRIPWIKYFFQIALPAFVVSQRAIAQSKIIVKEIAECNFVVGQLRIKEEKPKVNAAKELRGKIIDGHGNPVSYATVVKKDTKAGALADSNGYFKIKAPINSILVFSAIGYLTKEIKVNNSDFLNIVFDKNEIMMLGEVVVAGLVRSTPVKPVPLIQKIIDTAFTRFSVYPNPVTKNASLNISLKKFEIGKYFISILNSSGETIQSNEVHVESKNQVIDYILKEISAGTYFVRLANKKIGKQYTEKIIVQ